MIPLEQAQNLKEKFFKRVNYYPHKNQEIFHSSFARFKIIACGARWGKSMAAAAEVTPFLLLPDYRIWIISSTYDLSEREFNWVLHFCGEYKMENGKRLVDFAKVGNAAKGSRYIKFPWGSFVETKSTKTPESILGDEINAAILAEASTIPYSLYKRYIRPRIGPRNGTLTAPSTPCSDGGLLKDFYDRGQSKDAQWKEWESWQFATIDNPTFNLSEYETARQELPKEIFKEQYEGLFVSRKGRVFPSFCDSHVVNELPEKINDWPVFRAIHHEANSFNNPFVCIWIAVNPETRELYIYDELYKDKALLDDECRAILEKSRGRRIIATIIDYYNPAIKESLKSFIATTVNNEKKYSKKFATVKRIQALQTSLKLREDGTSSIHIYSKCENLIREMTACKWPAAKREESEMAESEMPTTKHISTPMALSYVVAFSWCSRGVDVYTAQGLTNAKKAS